MARGGTHLAERARRAHVVETLLDAGCVVRAPVLAELLEIDTQGAFRLLRLARAERARARRRHLRLALATARGLTFERRSAA